MKTTYVFGPYTLEVRNRALLRDGQPVPIAPKVFDTLLILAEAEGSLVSKADILERVWKNTYIEESVIKQNISLVRRALEPGFPGVEPILTVPRRGYRFGVPVLCHTTAPGTPEQAASDVAMETTAVAHPAKRFSMRAAITTLAVAIFALALLGAASYRHYVRSQQEAGRSSVLILGFQNLSGQPDVNWVSIALMEILHSDLASSEKLQVIPDESVIRMQSELKLTDKVSLSPETLARIRNDVGCDWVVSGAYLRIGDALRLDVHLQDARTGKTLGVFSSTQPANDLLKIIADTGNQLRQKLGVTTLSPTEHQSLDASVPVQPETLQLYVEGLEKLRIFDGQAALVPLQQAAALEPNYPLVHSALSSAWTLIGDEKQAAHEAEAAFNLSARLSREDHLRVESEYERATRQWDKAIQTDTMLWKAFPDNSDYGVQLAQTLTLGGRPKDALAVLSKLEAKAKNDPRPALAESSVQYQMGNYAKLLAAAHHAAEQAHASGAQILLGRARTFEGDADTHLGQLQQARIAYAEAITLAQQYNDKVGLMHALRRDGDALIAAGEIDEARVRLQQDQQIAFELHNEREQANALIAIALTYEEQQDWAKQLELFQRAEQIAEQIADKRLVLVSYAHIGMAQQNLKQLKSAEETLQNALTMARSMSAHTIEARVLGDLGVTHAQMGQISTAHAEAEQAVQIARQSNDRGTIAHELDALSRVLILQKQFGDARKALDEECRILSDTGEKFRLQRCQTSSAELTTLEHKTR